MRSLRRWVPGAAGLIVVMAVAVLTGLPRSASQDLNGIGDSAI
jgi:hypothetical protein